MSKDASHVTGHASKDLVIGFIDLKSVLLLLNPQSSAHARHFVDPSGRLCNTPSFIATPAAPSSSVGAGFPRPARLTATLFEPFGRRCQRLFLASLDPWPVQCYALKAEPRTQNPIKDATVSEFRPGVWRMPKKQQFGRRFPQKRRIKSAYWRRSPACLVRACHKRVGGLVSTIGRI